MNETTAAMKPQIPIDEIILHVGAHIDECEGYRRVRAYGEKCFPGCSKAQVRFTLGLPARPDAAFDAEKKLPIGCGQTRFDEHGKKDENGNEMERLPNECATTLVSAYLGLNHDHILKRMAVEVLRCDTRRGVWLTELPELAKMLHRRLSNADEFVLRWNVKALNAVQHQLYYEYAPVAGEKSVLQIFEELVQAKHFSSKTEMEKTAAENTRQLLQESVSRKDKLVFELAFVVECLYRTKHVSMQDILDWVRFPLEHLYADHLDFLKCVELCKTLRKEKKSWYDIPALVGKKKRTLPLFFCRTDNAMMLRAARYCKAAVVILRNSRGQVNAFIDSNTRGLNLVDFTRMIRWLELPNKSAATWEDLGQEGVYPLVPHWYFFRKAQQILNGSLTHPNTPATEISSQTILEIARHAFHYKKGVPAWRRKHRAWEKRTVHQRRSGKKVDAKQTEQPAVAKPAADAKTPATAVTTEPAAPKSEAGTNDIEEALKNAKPRKPRSRKPSPEAKARGEQNAGAAA